MANRLHHAAIVVTDLESSLRFWRDGIGLDVLMDEKFDGAWTTLFHAREDRLRSVFLGDPASADAGIVELVEFAGGADGGSTPRPAPTAGFFLLSFFVDLAATEIRLRDLGFALRTRIGIPAGDRSVDMATVLAPEGVLVELVDHR